ncbi:MAG: ATP-binding protein [Candidatus Zixiibacteriota bacterium]
MTFTQRIRFYLFAGALLPPLLIMAVIYFHAAGQAEEIERQNAFDEIQKFNRYRQSFVAELRQKLLHAAADPVFSRAVTMLRSGRRQPVDLTGQLNELDFVEVVDSSNRVLLSANRPALVGDTVLPGSAPAMWDSLAWYETVEYDLNGAHAAFALLIPMDSNRRLYAGEYFDQRFLEAARGVINANLDVVFSDDSISAQTLPASIETGTLYRENDLYRSLLAGGKSSGFYLSATITTDSQKPVFRSLLAVAGAVAVGSVAIALALGFYMSYRTKREVDNLITATSRVADGDLNTTVMAYEEGEFAHLADSFSAMIAKLKESQQRLAVSQKIAAWQTMGRKIAHEVKNSLTPIAVCADDLRRSYQEGLPDFDSVLDKNTQMIRTEVNRLTRLLDEFVRFARMAPPIKTETSVEQLQNALGQLYRRELSEGRLVLVNRCGTQQFPLDPEQIKQLLINLVKNSLEASSDGQIVVECSSTETAFVIDVLDDGPGFPDEKLQRGFEPYLSTKKDGSGLGLAICQRIAVDHGGTIDMFNRSDGGAGVRLTIPRE